MMSQKEGDIVGKISFKSKRDIWLGILVWGLAGFPISTVFIQPNALVVLIALFYLSIISWFWFGTGYTFVDENRLLITCGPIRGTVFINKIKSVKTSRAPWSSAALSIDRLKITTSQGVWNSVWYISPKDKDGFIKELKKRNPLLDIVP